MTAREVARIADDAPATVFAPCPVGAYRRGVEDHREGAWFCPWQDNTPQAAQYRQGWQEAGAVWVYSEDMQDVEVMQ